MGELFFFFFFELLGITEIFWAFGSWDLRYALVGMVFHIVEVSCVN